MTTQGRFCDLLNTLLRADPEATEKLLAARVKFNEEALKSIDVPLHPDGVGVLGLINSIVGYPVVGAEVNNETGRIDEFRLVGKEECSSL